MENIIEIKSKITAMINERYFERKSFEEFAAVVMEMGIVRISFEAFSNELHFFSNDTYVHSIVRTDLVESMVKDAWTLGKALDKPRVEKALQELDARQLTSINFHRELFSAGVVSCQVFLLPKMAYYMGQDGSFYLEKY